MTQSTFASSQVVWQHDRQNNVPWKSIYVDATAFRDYQRNTEPRKHNFRYQIRLTDCAQLHFEHKEFKN